MTQLVGERLELEFVLTYGSCKLVKSLVLTAKSPFGVFLWKNGSFSELGHPGFIVFLVEDWVFYRFVTLRGDAFGKDYGFEFCGRQALKCDLVVKTPQLY